MAKMVTTLMGVAFLLAGLLGFFFHNMLGMHLSLTHNLIHIVSGAVSLFIGLKGSIQTAKFFGFAFGGFYLLLGFIGYWFGLTSYESLPPEVSQGVNERMFRIIPTVLELGLIDHIVHIVIGAIYMIAAFWTRGNMTRYLEGTPE